MLTLRRASDPEMDQELYTVGCMLNITAYDMIRQQGRLSLMDGSESDDEDQHSWSSVRKEVESQPRAVPVLIIL